MSRVVILLFVFAGGTIGAEQPLARLGSDRLRQNERVAAMAYSADGRMLASADGGTIHIWNAADGKPLHHVACAGTEVFALCLTSDGKSLRATGVGGGLTRLFHIDPNTGKMLKNLVVLPWAGEGRFSNDGEVLALHFDQRAKVKVFNAATGETLAGVNLTHGECTALAFHPAGSSLAVATVKDWIGVLNWKSGKFEQGISTTGGHAELLAFTPDGKDLIAKIRGPGQTRVMRVEAASGKVRWTTPVHQADELLLVEIGKYVLIYSRIARGDALLWRWLDAKSGDKLPPVLDADEARFVALRPDEKVLAIGGSYGHISQWDLHRSKRLDDSSADPPEPLRALHFDVGGRTIRGWARGWYEWDVRNGVQKRLSPTWEISASDPVAESLEVKKLAIAKLPPDRDGNRRRLEVVNLHTGKQTHVCSVASDDWFRFLPGGRLAVVHKDGVTIYDEAGRPGPTFAVRRGIDAFEISENGKTMIFGSTLGENVLLQIMDVSSKPTARTFSIRLPDGAIGRGASELQAFLSPDGGKAALSFRIPSSDKSRKFQTLWFDTRDGRYSYGAEGLLRQSVAFSTDARQAICFRKSSSTVELHELASGRLRATIETGASVNDVALSPDGRTLACATTSGPIELFAVPAQSPSTQKWSENRAKSLWEDLSSNDANAAFLAMHLLCGAPSESVMLLKKKIEAVPLPTNEWIAERIAKLDSNDFRQREKAGLELALQGELILQPMLDAVPRVSSEAGERLRSLIPKAAAMTPLKLRNIRSCELLEAIGTAEAVELLAEFAKGAAGATLTREAADSLARLKKRS